MKFVVQRVKGSVEIKSELNTNSKLSAVKDSFDGVGLVVLLAWSQEDSSRDLAQIEQKAIKKISRLRIFPDCDGKMNLNLESFMTENKVSGGILWVPQFTLCGELKSGFRPSFSKSLEPQVSSKRFNVFKNQVLSSDKSYKNIFGVFGADMELSFTNWGPLTLNLEY